jgi:hypothetical protein
LPANTFTDALGLKMTFAAYEVSGPNVASWLHFNATLDEFYGTIPGTASGTIGLEVVATNSQKMTAQDFFSVTFVSGSAHGTTAAAVGSSGLLPTPPVLSGLISLHS